MRRFLPELIALPLLPCLIAQGRRTRRRTPRLAESPEPCHGIAGAGHRAAPLTLLALGESPVAGVGVASHEEGITGQTAKALASRLRRPVIWRACGRNGITAGEALTSLLPSVDAAPVDIVLVAFGVNDTTAFHSVGRWQSDMSAVLQAVMQRCTPRLLLLSGVPPLNDFPALPQPLRWVMGMKARALDRALAELAAGLPRTRYVPFTPDVVAPDLMAADGYHPSAHGCMAWARLLVDACVPDLRIETVGQDDR